MTSRSFFAAVAAAVALCAAPQPLTTIQDTLYKADGTRFNGSLTISWTTFEAVDHTQVLQQTATVTVVDGNLHVQLVPTTTATPAAVYTVVYNSDGRIQFQETWAVPSSTQSLRVRDVRISTAGGASGETGATPVQESDVTGLVADLGARPLKGPAYSAGRVAWVNALGSLETVTGSPSDCVRVDGTSGPCGGTLPSFTDNESPAGLVDGSNTSFVLSAVPTPTNSLAVYRNGMLQKATVDYSLNGNTIQFVAGAVPQPSDALVASYRIPGGINDTAQMYPTPQVLCNAIGASTTSSTMGSVGSCNIPGGFLAAGDRIEVRFDLDHQGTAGGYSFEVHWGTTTILHRDAAAGDTLATARADLALKPSGAQFSNQSWGTVLALNSGVGTAADDFFTNGIAIDFRAQAATGDTVTLRNYSVVRVP